MDISIFREIFVKTQAALYEWRTEQTGTRLISDTDFTLLRLMIADATVCALPAEVDRGY